MKSIRIPAVLFFLLVLTPAVLAADFGIRAGRYDDFGEDFFGAEMVFDAGAINVNPNAEYVKADQGDAGSANIDITFDLGHFSSVTPYVGAGVGLWYADSDTQTSTDLLGNLLGGVQFQVGRVKPYAQLKYFHIFQDDEDEGSSHDLALTIGLRF